MKEKNENTPSSDEFDYFTQKSQAENFDYRLWLLKRSDYESRAKLIFFDLFHGLESEAVKEYNARRSEAGGFYLSAMIILPNYLWLNPDFQTRRRARCVNGLPCVFFLLL